MHKSLDEFEIRPDATTGFLVSVATDRVTFGKMVSSRFLASFYQIHFVLAGNNDIHMSLEEFEIRRDPTMDYGVGCT